MATFNDCIEWSGYKDRDGYGTYYVDKKTQRAHRYFYEKKYGKIPKGLIIDHLCNNPSCINTEHMQVVTIQENTIRGKSAKLTYQDVEDIKTKYKSSKITQIELAMIYKIGQDEISRIVNKRRWA